MPFPASWRCKLPGVSWTLMRSPVETRWPVADAMLVAGEEADDVVVHHEAEDSEQKHEADLDEALLHGEAEVAAERAFDGEHEDVAAVEYRDGKEIQDAEIDAEKRHEEDELGSAELRGFRGHVNDADGPGEILERDAAGEKSGEHGEDLLHHGDVLVP